MSTVISAFFHAIRYAVIALIAIGSASFVFAYTTKLYPVALVDNSPVWMKTWEQAVSASESYTNFERGTRGERALDFSFSENAGVAARIKRDALTFLIEDKIIVSHGPLIVDGFGSEVGERIDKILKESSQDPKAIARDVYGLDYEEYRRIILLPQARRIVLAERIRGRSRTMDEWLFEQKIRTPIKLYFIPFTWNGKTIE